MTIWVIIISSDEREFEVLLLACVIPVPLKIYLDTWERLNRNAPKGKSYSPRMKTSVMWNEIEILGNLLTSSWLVGSRELFMSILLFQPPTNVLHAIVQLTVLQFNNGHLFSALYYILLEFVKHTPPKCDLKRSGTMFFLPSWCIFWLVRLQVRKIGYFIAASYPLKQVALHNYPFSDNHHCLYFLLANLNV